MGARSEKRAAEEKETRERIERFASQATSLIAAHLPEIGGAVMGAVALYPQRFIVEESVQEKVETFDHIDPKAAEQCEREYLNCIFACNQQQFGRRECIELCGEERNRCLNEGGKRVLDYQLETWMFKFKVEVLAQNLMPNVEIPLVGWPVRDAMAITTSKRGQGKRFPDESAAEETARKRAQADAEASVARDLLFMGIGGGTIMTGFLKAFGDIVRGIGEIVPG